MATSEFRYFRGERPVAYYRVDSDALPGGRVRRQEDGLWVSLPDDEGVSVLKLASTHEVPVDAVPCPFCLVSAGLVSREVLAETSDALVISLPGGGLVPGHALAIAREHVKDAVDDPEVTGRVFAAAAAYAKAHLEGALNLVTSVGRPATQTEPHLHIHLVPREFGDGLPLLWDRGDLRG